MSVNVQVKIPNKNGEDSAVESKEREVHDGGECWIFQCPHCDQFAEVLKNQVNCQIFRHAVYKNNINLPINPHASKQVCDALVAQGQVYGCAKPFRIIMASSPEGKNRVIQCEYI